MFICNEIYNHLQLTSCISKLRPHVKGTGWKSTIIGFCVKFLVANMGHPNCQPIHQKVQVESVNGAYWPVQLIRKAKG